MSIRIVVCLDIEAATPTEAYKKLYQQMPKLHDAGIDWESTDEWYDEDGEALSPEQITEIRQNVLPKYL